MSMAVKAEGSQRDFKCIGQRYTVYGAGESYFTQKVLMGCGWHLEGQFTYVPKVVEDDPETLEQRVGTHDIPVLAISGHSSTRAWVLADSTPILQLLDSRLPAPKFYPGDAFTVCVVLLLEEYFDKWMARLCIHARRRRDATAPDTAKDMVIEPSGGFSRAICAKRAIKEQHRAGEEQLVRLMAAFNAHLAAGNRFLLGDSPCAVDCVLMGGLRAHFLDDVCPSELAGLEPLRWWCNKESCRPVPATAHAQCLDPQRLPAFVHIVLREMGASYNFALASAASLQQESRSRVASVNGECAPALCPPNVKKFRGMLNQSWRVALGADKSAEFALRQMLAKYALHDLYAPTASNL